jgi:hypothetical protein
LLPAFSIEIEVLNHVIVGKGNRSPLREPGYLTREVSVQLSLKAHAHQWQILTD